MKSIVRIAACAILLLHTPAWALQWSVSTVATDCYAARPTLKLNSNGNPCIGYGWDYGVGYAYRSGNNWTNETVASGGPGGEASMALGANGTPHITYWSLRNYSIMHATKVNGVWASDVVDNTVKCGSTSSIAVDSNGKPHVAYENYDTWQIRQAVWNGTSWARETVTDGVQASIAVDQQNNTRLAVFTGGYSGKLNYAAYNGSAWDVANVDPLPYTGLWSSVAIDSNGRPHISYIDGNKYTLKYATFDGTSWIVQTVDSLVGQQEGTSIAVDANGIPHISYCYTPNGFVSNLRYATLRDGQWITETVDANGQVGMYSSIALDAAGMPKIAYYDWSGAIKYASGTVPEPSSILALLTGLAGISGLAIRKRR